MRCCLVLVVSNARSEFLGIYSAACLSLLHYSASATTAHLHPPCAINMGVAGKSIAVLSVHAMFETVPRMLGGVFYLSLVHEIHRLRKEPRGSYVQLTW